MRTGTPPQHDAQRAGPRDAETCAAITRRNARTFSLAARLLPREKRRGAFALYAFCRRADDIVDSAHADHTEPAAVRLARYRAALDASLAGHPPDAVFREVQHAVNRFGVPARALYELLDGIARDLRPVRYETWREVAAYAAGVASSVGEMCTFVFGVEHAALLGEAVRRGRTLGLAMQLTNILRDVGEDAKRGRCYLPDEDLLLFGFTRDDVLGNPRIAHAPRWPGLMQFEIARARALYDGADPGIALLAPDARQCASACARGYAEILGAIEARAYDTIAARAVVTRWRKASVLWSAWRLRTA
jgi:phytoene synthase